MVQEIGQAAAAAAATTSATDFTSSAMSGLMIMYFQRWLKGFNWYEVFVRTVPGLDKWAHRVMAIALSIIGALGASLVVMYDMDAGGQIIMTLPPLAVFLKLAWDAVWTFGFQQLFYDATRTAVNK